MGANNLRHFLSFLVSTAMLCVYGTGLLAQIVLGIVREKRLLSLSYIDPITKMRHVLRWDQVLSYLMATEYVLVTLTLFLALVALLLLSFTGYHLYLIARGTTTNETFRWDDVRDYLKQGHTLLLPASSPAARGLPPAEPAPAQAAPAAATNRKGRGQAAAADADTPAPDDVVLSHTKQLVNVYNQGIVRNFVDALVPPPYFG